MFKYVVLTLFVCLTVQTAHANEVFRGSAKYRTLFQDYEINFSVSEQNGRLIGLLQINGAPYISPVVKVVNGREITYGGKDFSVTFNSYTNSFNVDPNALWGRLSTPYVAKGKPLHTHGYKTKLFPMCNLQLSNL